MTTVSQVALLQGLLIAFALFSAVTGILIYSFLTVDEGSFLYLVLATVFVLLVAFLRALLSGLSVEVQGPIKRL
mgnify:CR=1 FL=1